MSLCYLYMESSDICRPPFWFSVLWDVVWDNLAYNTEGWLSLGHAHLSLTVGYTRGPKDAQSCGRACPVTQPSPPSVPPMGMGGEGIPWLLQLGSLFAPSWNVCGQDMGPAHIMVFALFFLLFIQSYWMEQKQDDKSSEQPSWPMR